MADLELNVLSNRPCNNERGELPDGGYVFQVHHMLGGVVKRTPVTFGKGNVDPYSELTLSEQTEFVRRKIGKEFRMPQKRLALNGLIAMTLLRVCNRAEHQDVNDMDFGPQATPRLERVASIAFARGRTVERIRPYDTAHERQVSAFGIGAARRMEEHTTPIKPLIFLPTVPKERVGYPSYAIPSMAANALRGPHVALHSIGNDFVERIITPDELR